MAKDIFYEFTYMSTLRGRLSLWYLKSVGLIILIFLFAVSVLFWFTLQNQIDHHIHIAVNEAHQIVQNYRGEERDTLIKNLVSAQGMTVIVLSPDGAPILETNSPDVAIVTEHQLQKLLITNKPYDSNPIHFTESNIRFAALHVQVNAGRGIVAVGYSTKILYATFYKMLILVAFTFVFLVLPIAFIGYKLLKKQLLPLESIASQAKLIASTSILSKRISIQDDTYELLTIEQALNTMLSQLEKIFKSEREFFSDAAHTLKTPLAIFRSQVENSLLSEKSKKELLKTIDTTNDTIQDLLFLSKIAGKPENTEDFSLTYMVANLTELATTLGEYKNIEVISNIQSGVKFRADKKLFQRALSNIIHNAIIYNKQNGIVNISLIKLSRQIKIIIKDSGVGISKRDLTYVFTRFFRGSNIKNPGSGLGLAISSAVVENLGGKILLKSQLGKGTTVTIII